ncbi:MAG: hypothetical protein ACXW29_06870 [Thermoanaerobaculia bacterium]
MKKISRRSFTRQAIVAATAAAVLPAAIAQTDPAAPKTTPATPKPPDSPPALSPSSQAEVDARVQWIVTKYGSRLDETQRADIRRLITGGQSGVETMRKYELQNAAGPAEPFRIYRRTAKK